MNEAARVAVAETPDRADAVHAEFDQRRVILRDG